MSQPRLILRQLRKIVQNLEVLSIPMSTFSVTAVSPDSLLPTPSSSSTMKTPDLHLSGPSVSLIEMKMLQKKIERIPDASEPAAAGYGLLL
jgi:hypothetical protein